MNAGFFTREETAFRTTFVSKNTKCGACKLFQTCRSPKMKETGEGRRGILLIAEAPGETEDRRNEQLVGKVGKWTRRILKKYGIDMNRDCWKINAVNCRPPDNRTPDDKEIEYCRPMVWDAIQRLKPKVIITMGEPALKSVLQHRFPEALGGISKWRGYQVPDRELEAWICPTFHPSFVNRTEYSNPAVEVLFKKDVKAAIKLADRTFPKLSSEEQKVTVLFSLSDVKNYLKDLIRTPPEFMAFDYETTGLKPQREGHEIVSVGISTDPESATAFMYHPDLQPYLRRILVDKRIKKIAQNLKFEDRWTSSLWGFDVANWFWDTMLASHCIDNRDGVTGLKFQAAAQFGVYDYDSHLSPFLKGVDPKDGNSMNRIREIPERDLLIYNGIDAMLELRLAMRQWKEMTDEIRPGYDLLHEGVLALSRVEQNGIHLDLAYCLEQERILTQRIDYLENRVNDDKIIRTWRKIFGKKFNLDSDDQLAFVLFDKLGYEPKSKTETGKPSTSEDSLMSLKIPVVTDLITIRRLKKTRATYLGGFIREQVDGVLHPFFDLNTTDTFRSSSSRPNFQNIPVRIKRIKKITRRAIIPSPGNMLMEVDYSGAEVRNSACMHKDPVMIRYIEDPTTDMHRDMAMEIYLIDALAAKLKPIRDASKNKFVFPEFYGSYYEQCARDLWEVIEAWDLRLPDGTSMKDHLRSKGIRTLERFTKHLKKVEDDFWGKRFKVYSEWKDRHVAEYHKNGYFITATGFRCGGVMSRNQSINYPIQGPAFHWLLWSLIQMDKEIRSRGLKTKIIGQIHDSIVLDVPPDEYEKVADLLRGIMTHRIREHWDWIIVPLEIDIEITRPDGSWYTKRKIKKVVGKGFCHHYLYEEKDDAGNVTGYECPVDGLRYEYI